MDLRPDVSVAEHYRLQSFLGEGGMGVVWSALDTRNDARVALKFLRPAAAASEVMKKRFLREARAAMAINHPNVVRIHETVDGPDGAPVMVMDLLEGTTLSALLHEKHRLDVREFARIFLPVVSAVGTAHQKGVVHRDLKPENIFLARSKTTSEPEVRVLDFGIAKLTATEGDAKATAGLTGDGAMLGTPYYMSPEQVFGEKDVDHRADIWALGVILYECLAGRKPVEGDTIGAILRAVTVGTIPPLSKMAPHLPTPILDLCDRMLTVDRAKRPQDLREVYETLKDFTDATAEAFNAPTLEAKSYEEFVSAPTLDSSGTTTADPLARSLERPGRRRAPMLALGGVVVAGGIAVAVLGARSGSHDAAPPPPAPAAASIAATVTQAPADPAPSTAPSVAPSAPSAAASTLLAPSSPKAKSAAASPKAAPRASSAAATTTHRLPGGVSNDVPF